MLFAKLLYLLLLTVLYLFSLLYMPEFSVYLLITMILLPVFLFASVHLQSRRLKLRLELPSEPIHCGERFSCRLIVENPSKMPMSMVELKMLTEHLTLCEKAADILSTSVPSGGTVSLTIRIQAVHTGCMKISVSRAYGLDALRLFRSRCKNLPHAVCTILPRLPDAPDKPFSAVFPRERLRPTSAPEEFLGIREYRSGDQLRAIHWKLSSRTPEPVVREYGEPVREPTTAALLYALSHPEHPDAGQRLDAMLEAVLAIAVAVCSSNHILHLMICSSDRYEMQPVEKAADVIPILCRLVEAPPADTDEGCREQLTRYGQGVHFCIADTISNLPENMTIFSAGNHSAGKNVVSITSGTAAETVYKKLSVSAGGDFYE